MAAKAALPGAGRGVFMARCRYWSLAERVRSPAAATPPRRRARRASGGVAALFPGPSPDPLAVGPRGGTQFQFGIDPGLARPGHEGEQGRADLTDLVPRIAVRPCAVSPRPVRPRPVGGGRGRPGGPPPRGAAP